MQCVCLQLPICALDFNRAFCCDTILRLHLSNCGSDVYRYSRQHRWRAFDPGFQWSLCQHGIQYLPPGENTGTDGGRSSGIPFPCYSRELGAWGGIRYRRFQRFSYWSVSPNVLCELGLRSDLDVYAVLPGGLFMPLMWCAERANEAWLGGGNLFKESKWREQN